MNSTFTNWSSLRSFAQSRSTSLSLATKRLTNRKHWKIFLLLYWNLSKFVVCQAGMRTRDQSLASHCAYKATPNFQSSERLPRRKRYGEDDQIVIRLESWQNKLNAEHLLLLLLNIRNFIDAEMLLVKCTSECAPYYLVKFWPSSKFINRARRYYCTSCKSLLILCDRLLPLVVGKLF